MNIFVAGVLFAEEQDGAYLVKCNYCHSPIGTLKFRLVVEAIFNTLGRGGVLCPPCRHLTCDVCGIRCLAGEEPGKVDGPKGEVRACLACKKTLESLSVAGGYKGVKTVPSSKIIDQK